MFRVTYLTTDIYSLPISFGMLRMIRFDNGVSLLVCYKNVLGIMLLLYFYSYLPFLSITMPSTDK